MKRWYPRSEREVRPLAQRVEIGVAGRPLAHLRAGRDRGAQVLDRGVVPAGPRLHAREVVQRGAVAGMRVEALADQRLRLVPLAGLVMRDRPESPLPGRHLVTLARLPADREHGRARLFGDGVPLR